MKFNSKQIDKVLSNILGDFSDVEMFKDFLDYMRLFGLECVFESYILVTIKNGVFTSFGEVISRAFHEKILELETLKDNVAIMDFRNEIEKQGSTLLKGFINLILLYKKQFLEKLNQEIVVKKSVEDLINSL